MSGTNYVVVTNGISRYNNDISFFKNLTTILRKWWQDVLNIITRRDPLIDWLFSYD